MVTMYLKETRQNISDEDQQKVKMFLMRSLLDPLGLKRISENNYFRYTVNPEKAVSQKIVSEIETIKYEEDNPHFHGSDKKIGRIGLR